MSSKTILSIIVAVIALGLIVFLATRPGEKPTDQFNYQITSDQAENPSETPAPENQINPSTATEQKKPMNETITTKSGLQYQVLHKGTGTVHPTLTSTVKVHYHGTLLDGTVFDSSVQRGEPIEFPLGGVIKGWQEGVQLMMVGDKFKFTIPADLAYGKMSPSPLIPPNSTLVFEVELLEIK